MGFQPELLRRTPRAARRHPRRDGAQRAARRRRSQRRSRHCSRTTARDRLGALQTPALVIAADDDIIIRLSLSHRMYEELPHGSWAIVPGGHAAFLENPEPVESSRH